MRTVFLALGSNLGDRIYFLLKAVDLINEVCPVKAISPVYETEPWGYENQGRFLNCAVKIGSPLDPYRLLRFLKEVEKKAGRKERFRWGPREIDIDILLFEDEVINTPELTVPHRYLLERDFFLKPLLDIDPFLKDPRSGKPLKDFLKDKNLEPYCCLVLQPQPYTDTQVDHKKG